MWVVQTSGSSVNCRCRCRGQCNGRLQVQVQTVGAFELHWMAESH